MQNIRKTFAKYLPKKLPKKLPKPFPKILLKMLTMAQVEPLNPCLKPQRPDRLCCAQFARKRTLATNVPLSEFCEKSRRIKYKI